MPIRSIVCCVLVLVFAIRAYKDWFTSLCAAVLLMSVMQHPDVIDTLKNLGGIQGLNPWNFLIANVFIAWLRQRKFEGPWDIPNLIRNLMVMYFFIILWGAIRLCLNPDIEKIQRELVHGSMISEYVINPLKWIIPGVLFADGARSRRRVIMGLRTVALLFLFLALQTIKHMPLAYATNMDEDFQHLAYKLVQVNVGYNRVTLSMMLGGGAWAVLALIHLAKTFKWRAIIIGAALTISFGQALTGGRSGYFAWALVGFILCLARWRIALPFLPVMILVALILLPNVRERILAGFSGLGDSETVNRGLYDITSGRNIAWPYVIDKIEENPIIGYGREGMTTTGIAQRILDDTGGTESFPHPHNAYLEVTLDCGLIGLGIVLMFYSRMVWVAMSLFRDKSDPIFGAAGGASLALMLGLLVAAMGGESFFPNEGSVGMWATMGIMFRVWLERRRSQLTGEPLFGEGKSEEAEMEPMEGVEVDSPASA